MDEALQNLEARKNFLLMIQISEAIKIKADKFNIFMKERKSIESNWGKSISIYTKGNFPQNNRALRNQ